MAQLTAERAKRARAAIIECLECSDLTEADREALEAASEVLADRLSITDLDPSLRQS